MFDLRICIFHMGTTPTRIVISALEKVERTAAQYAMNDYTGEAVLPLC